jgi:hypothetical protein
VADDANQPAPRLTLLLAQRLREVGQRHELVRRAALPELRAPDLPPAHAAGEAQILNRGGAAEDVLQTEVVGDLADQVAAFAREQPFAIPD